MIVIPGYHYAVDSLKSLLLIMATIDHHISVEKAVELATLEQIFQVQFSHLSVGRWWVFFT